MAFVFHVISRATPGKYNMGTMLQINELLAHMLCRLQHYLLKKATS